jgi:hypothetical protein
MRYWLILAQGLTAALAFSQQVSGPVQITGGVSISIGPPAGAKFTYAPNPVAFGSVVAGTTSFLPDGVVATFVPNGCLERKEVHSIWGHVHPLLIDADRLRAIAASCGFTGQCYSLLYNLAEVQSGCPAFRFREMNSQSLPTKSPVPPSARISSNEA